MFTASSKTDPIVSAAPRPMRPDHDRLVEQALARLHAETPGTVAHRRQRDHAIAACLPMATRLAARYRGHGENADDLRQIAALGVIKAVDGYDPGRGGSFSAFAVPTVLGELRRHLRDRTWNVRVPRRMQELRLRIAAATEELTQRLCRRPTVADIADHLGLTKTDVVEGMRAAQAYQRVSLDGSNPSGEMLCDSVGMAESGYEYIENRLAVRKALTHLPARQRLVLQLRFFADLTQAEIAAHIGVSQMHISRLLAQSLAALRQELTREEPPPPTLTQKTPATNVKRRHPRRGRPTLTATVGRPVGSGHATPARSPGDHGTIARSVPAHMTRPHKRRHHGPVRRDARAGRTERGRRRSSYHLPVQTFCQLLPWAARS